MGQIHRVNTPTGSSRLTPRIVRAVVPLDDVQRQIVVAAEAGRREAEDANRAKLEWLRAMSHELRTPLNAIGGFVQLLKSGARGEVPERMRSDLDRIERNQRHMSSLISDVLHIARLEAGRVEFDVGPVPVSRLLLDFHDYVPQDEKARGRIIAVHKPPADLVVHADEDKTRQILLNLVTNAIKHTPADASIDVGVDELATHGNQVCLAVRDNGPGIPPDRLQRVFEPFFQAGSTLSRPVDGLGLGLTIARELARGMSGELLVESEMGVGTTFFLRLKKHG